MLENDVNTQIWLGIRTSFLYS